TPRSGAGITIVSLGDSLTAGEGEDSGRGYPARIENGLDAEGQDVAQAINLGRSGWTSQEVMDGGEGDRSQLVAATEAIAEAQQQGNEVIATLLIGSNDLWNLYRDEEPTTEAAERENLETYRQNVQQIVTTLRQAGAKVV